MRIILPLSLIGDFYPKTPEKPGPANGRTLVQVETNKSQAMADVNHFGKKYRLNFGKGKKTMSLSMGVHQASGAPQRLVSLPDVVVGFSIWKAESTPQ
jgi:hypothetical protein